jgi:DNA-binding helix-hairpin-helix protein with protein kinase domain
LHKERRVFGDVRLENMIFLDDGKAYLIDLDFFQVMDEAKPPLCIEG